MFLVTHIFLLEQGFQPNKWSLADFSEAVIGGILQEKVFLEISQHSQEKTCTRVSFLTKLLWYNCFPVNFLQNTSGRLFLSFPYINKEFFLSIFNTLSEFCNKIVLFFSIQHMTLIIQAFYHGSKTRTLKTTYGCQLLYQR